MVPRWFQNLSKISFDFWLCFPLEKAPKWKLLGGIKIQRNWAHFGTLPKCWVLGSPGCLRRTASFLVLYPGVIIRYDLRLRACGVTVDKPVMIGDDARVRGSCLTMNSTTNLMWCLFVCLSAQEVSTCARWAKLIHSLLFCFSGLHFLFTLRHLHRRLRCNESDERRRRGAKVGKKEQHQLG